MAIIKPFRGIRFNNKIIKNPGLNISPPFDAITPELNESLQKRSDYNIVRLEIARRNKSDRSFLQVAETQSDWFKSNILIRDKEPALYITEESFDFSGTNVVRRGIISAVRLEEYDSKIIFPHENVRSEWVEERVKLMDVGKSNYSPLLVLFRDDLRNTIGAVIRAVSGGEPDTIYHSEDLPYVKLWKVLDKGTIEIISSALRNSPLFIADGHHRYKAALRYRARVRSNREILLEESLNYRMMMLISIDQPGLLTLGYHRFLDNLSIDQSNDVLNIIEKKCNIETLDLLNINNISKIISELGQRQNEEVHFMVYAPSQRKLFIAKNKEKKLSGDDLYKSEHSWLHREIISGIFNKTTEMNYINPVHDINSLIGLVNNSPNSIGIIMRPINMDEFVSIVTRGWRLPPKATNFYPKTSAGVVMQDLKGFL